MTKDIVALKKLRPDVEKNGVQRAVVLFVLLEWISCMTCMCMYVSGPVLNCSFLLPQFAR